MSYTQLAINIGRTAAGLGATVTGAAATTFAFQSLVHVGTAFVRTLRNMQLEDSKKSKDVWKPITIDNNAPIHQKAVHYAFRGATRLDYQDKGIIALGLFAVSVVLQRVSINPTGLVGKVVSYLPVVAKATPIANYLPRI